MSDFEENFVSERRESQEQYGSVPRWLLKLKPSSHAVRIYVYLDASFGNSKRGIFPGQDTMAEENELSRSTIQRALSELQALGAMKITRRGQGKTNLYHLMWNNPAKPALVQKPAGKPAAKKQPVQVPANPRVRATKEVAPVDQAGLERQRAKRAEEQRQRDDEAAWRKTMTERDAQHDQETWHVGVLDGMAL